MAMSLIIILPVFLFVFAFGMANKMGNKMAAGRSIYQINIFQSKVTKMAIAYLVLVMVAGLAYYGVVYLEREEISRQQAASIDKISSEADLVRLMNNIHLITDKIYANLPYDIDGAEDYHLMGVWNQPWDASRDLIIWEEDGYRNDDIIVVRESDRADIQVKAYKVTTLATGIDVTDMIRPPVIILEDNLLIIEGADWEEQVFKQIGFATEFTISQFQTDPYEYWGGFENTSSYSPTIIEIEYPRGIRVQNKTYADMFFY